MRNGFIILIAFCIMACSSEQKQSTNNETGVNFQQTDVPGIFAQAKKQQKLVLIDVFTDG